MATGTSLPQPKRVLIDLDRLREPTSGLGHVALYFGERLAKRAAEIADMRFTFLLPPSFKGYFGNAVEYVTTQKRYKFFPSLHSNFDLWYCPHQDIVFPPRSGAKFIFTINDLNFLKEKSPARCRARLKRIQKFIERAHAVTAISQTTAEDVQAHLKVGATPLIVLPCGLELKKFAAPAAPEFVSPRPFFLTVGVHKHTKNYRALVGLMERMPEYDLVMLGNFKTSAGHELQELLKKSSCRERVHFRGIVSDEEKYWSYLNCQAVLFPSISEGMGYPPLEAMQVRKPVFVFRESAVPETCGPHALYWSSQDAEVMAQETKQQLAWFQTHPQFAEEAYKHGMSFGWDPVVENYLALFRQALD